MDALSNPAVRLFVGGQAGTVQGEREDLVGDRCFSPCHPPQSARFADVGAVVALLDSGAFTDAPTRRLTPAQALDRQLRWEARASRAWGAPWQAHALVSYDRLIDETWTEGARVKRRWSVAAAEAAVRETVAAAAYLVGQRDRLGPRRLVLACQGVTPAQYTACAEAVLAHAGTGDWLGLGGWCILGRHTSLLPSFWATLHGVLPLAARAGVGHVHVFGVMWQRALGGLVYLADQAGLTVSTDSSAPILACTYPNPRKAGVRHPYWRENVARLKRELAALRESSWYRPPPLARQLRLL